MEEKYYIYKHTNKINGKIYIGQTKQEPSRRWRNGNGYQKCPSFWRAIEKYGWDNFNHEILEIGSNQEWANERESYWISYYDSINEELGYNIAYGGNNCMQQLWQNEEYRRKQCQSFTEARKRDWSNKEFAQTQLENMKKGIQKAWNDPIWKENRIQKMLGDKNSNAKWVQNVETKKIFTTITEAAKWAGLNNVSGIGQCCRGKRKTSGKHPETGEPLHWIFVEKNKVEKEVVK